MASNWARRRRRSAFDGGFVIGDGDGEFRGGGEVEINQGAGDGGVAQAAPEVAIDQELALMAVKGGVGAARVGGGEIGGFEFFDQPGAVGVLHATVEAAGDEGGAVFDGPGGIERDLAAVVRAAPGSGLGGRGRAIRRRGRGDASLRRARSRCA